MPVMFRRTPLALLLIAVLAGCRSGRPAGDGPVPSGFPERGDDPLTRTLYPKAATEVVLADAEASLPVFDGTTGEPITARRLHALLADADVILLGETHDDPVAHRLQLRFAREALATGGGALSLEMLDRDDAAAVGRVNGTSMAPEEIEAALAGTRLAQWPAWERFYLPIVQAAVAMGRPVVAANAPRRFADAARVAGYGLLKNLDAAQRRLFALPADPDAYPRYRARFETAMGGHVGVEGATTRPADEDDAGRMSAHQATAPTTNRFFTPYPQTTATAARPDPSTPDAYYRAQLVWDATMAGSIGDALSDHGRPVVHLVGNFHTDFDGGLTRMLRQGGPSFSFPSDVNGAETDRTTFVALGPKVLTVSFVPAAAARLRPVDEGRADVVVYTGEPERFPRLATRETVDEPTTSPSPTTRTSTFLFRADPTTQPTE